MTTLLVPILFRCADADIKIVSKVLITGAAGFIGSHSAGLFLDQGISVLGIDNFDPFYKRQAKEKNLEALKSRSGFEFLELDFCKDNLVEKLPGHVEAVIHLGAKAGVLPSIQQMEAYIDVNIKGTQRLLDWMTKIGCKKLVFASSSSVYGNSSVPFTETADVNTPLSPYAFTKKSGELLTHNFHYLYGVDVLNLRFFTVIGERQRPDLAIHKFVKCIIADEPITLYGDGKTSRDYTYVKDTAQGVFLAYEYLMNNSGVYDTINIGNSNPVSLLHMVETLEKVLEKKAIIKFDDKKLGDVDKTYADISKAEKLIGYKPETSFENGVRAFVQWYKSTQLDHEQ